MTVADITNEINFERKERKANFFYLRKNVYARRSKSQESVVREPVRVWMNTPSTSTSTWPSELKHRSMPLNLRFFAKMSAMSYFATAVADPPTGGACESICSVIVLCCSLKGLWFFALFFLRDWDAPPRCSA